MGFAHEWTKFRKKVEKEAVRFREHAQEELNTFKHWYDKHGPEEVKLTTSSKDQGKTWDTNVEVKPSTIKNNTTTKSSKPQAYSRSAAATAQDIAQGGMTKDEVIEYNLKHPNETAIRRN